MDEFFPQHKESAQVTNKKRKAEKQPIDEDLRNKARYYCICIEQWRSVSRYSAERLVQFVQENEFREQQHLQNQVFDFVQRGLGYLIDKFSGGNGFVSEQIENDQSLRSAIVAEGGNFVSLLNNKVKLLALLATDTMTGKLNQNLKEPKIVEIKNDDQTPVFFREAPGEREADMPTTGEVPWDSVCIEAVDNAGGGTQRDGEDTHVCESA
jgi:hypothetical protein